MEKSKYLLVYPDGYSRFGHQTGTILSGLFLAHLTNSFLIKPTYKYFSDKWNDFTDWSNSSFVLDSINSSMRLKIKYIQNDQSHIEGIKIIGPESNANVNSLKCRVWDTNSQVGLSELISTIKKQEEHSIINLPFDQAPGKMMTLLNDPLILKDVQSIFQFPHIKYIPSTPYLCIHIRRGDVTELHNSHLFVSNEFYFKLIKLMARHIPPDMPIVICTQGDVSWIRNRAVKDLSKEISSRIRLFSTQELFINDSEVDAFILMLNSDILISAGSSFSYLAGILGSQVLNIDISRENDEHFMKDFKRIHPDHNFDESYSTIISLLNSVY